MLSPVIGAWLTVDDPATTTPSSGTRSPGRISTTAPERYIAGGHLRGGAVGRSDVSRFRSEFDERADGVAGALQAERLDQLGDTEQPDHDRGLGPLADDHGADGGHRHQQVHRQPAGGECLPTLAQGLAATQRNRGECHRDDRRRGLIQAGNDQAFRADCQDARHHGGDDGGPWQSWCADGNGGRSDQAWAHAGAPNGGFEWCWRVERVANGHTSCDEVELQRCDLREPAECRTQVVLLGRAVQLLHAKHGSGHSLGAHGGMVANICTDCSDIRSVRSPATSRIGS